MKKSYIIPEALIVELNCRHAVLTVSAPGLEGTSTGGGTDDGGIDEGDVKESVNIWDEEW